MDKERKAYIIRNHGKYGIHNEQGQLLSAEEMLELLNILESNGETLDDFHDASLYNDYPLCGIYGTYADDDDTYRILMSYQCFMTVDDLVGYVDVKREEYAHDLKENQECYGSFAEYFRETCDEGITRTSDGYVLRYEY